MRLAKKKAVEITKELWEWCAETGKDKEYWPGWKKYHAFQSDCPLCEYRARHSVVMSCHSCPLLGMWTGKQGSRCFEGDSPYDLWVITLEDNGLEDIEARKQYAQQIVDLCDRWLKEKK